MGVDPAFQWSCHPQAARLIRLWVERLTQGIEFLATLQQRMLNETGTRLIDWIDHLVLPGDNHTERELENAGFELVGNVRKGSNRAGARKYEHPGGMFPVVLVSEQGESAVAIKVDSVSEFLAVHQLDTEIDGTPVSPLRLATAARSVDVRLEVIERHGSREFVPHDESPERLLKVLQHGERFRRRRRSFDRDAEGFQHAGRLFEQAAKDVGRDWACDLFFAAERTYWQSRNRAAGIQKSRQDRLGLGWANHDHHTYRSSREQFASLIELLELMGFQCRERFYGGAEAGWGAQVLEQPVAGVVVFADVDLSPSEVTGDFAHNGLTSQAELGTVGLWCSLHGEAMLEAGMHHLECQFDFEAARTQLAEAGVQTMRPFTYFEFLKQAFTEGEVWAIPPRRIEAALQGRFLTESQAERFREQGSIGSHLEILQRDDGYKGFNQTGISEIIRQTDPRHAGKSLGT